jgi:hypothetical protein
MLTTYKDNLNAALEAPSLDPLYLSVAHSLLSGDSIDSIADALSLTTDRVTAIAEREDVRRYVDTVYLTQGYLNRVKRLKIINRVIDAKLEEAEETGVYSKRDLLEWLKLLNEMETSTKPKQPTTAVQINQQTNNNYATLLQDLLGE